MLPATLAVAEAERPNIIFIFTDDQRADAVGYAGNLAVQTPHLDALARGGLIFQNCFVNSSICSLNRANVIAGQYPERHGIDNFHKMFNRKQLEQSVPGRLQKAGYQTGFFGKWGIGDNPQRTHAAAQVFDYWAGQPMQTSFFHEKDCRYVNFNGFDRPLNDLCDCPADARGRAGFRNRVGKDYLTDPIHTDSQVIPSHVEAFLEGRDAAKPFALMLFFKGPHSPYEDWDPAVRDTVEGIDIPAPPAATREASKQVPPTVKSMLGRLAGSRLLNNPKNLEKLQKDYFRLISSLDLGVGRVLAALEKAGVDENTVILFTSDNGLFHAEHGLTGKWLMYEPSLRVPGFVYDPREEGGVVSESPVITTDFSVSMLGYAGLEKPESMTGRDLRVLRTNPEASWREDFLYSHPYGHNGRIPKTLGVRNDRFTYTRYTATSPLQEQLFDNQLDPNQLKNLVDDPAHAETLATLRERCDELLQQVR